MIPRITLPSMLCVLFAGCSANTPVGDPGAQAASPAPRVLPALATPPPIAPAKPTEPPEAIQMTPVAYGYDTADPRFSHDDRYKVSLKFHNSSEKAISAFKGAITFKDAFGEKFKSVRVEVQDGIPAGGDLVWDGELDLNQFMADDNKLKDTPTDKLSLEWKTEFVLFAGEGPPAGAPAPTTPKQTRALELAKSVTMEPVSYGFDRGDPRWQHDDRYKLSLKFSNQADKDISAVKGVIVFKDAFGQKIKGVKLEVQDTIPRNGHITWEGGLDLNQFLDEDNKLISTPKEKLTIEWLPDTILFTDGSRVGL
jgi:hypothetical protein